MATKLIISSSFVTPPKYFGNRQGIIRFNVVVAALWTIWLEQNNRVFNNKFASNVNIWEDILQVYWPLVLKTSTIFGILSCIT
ncbi:hypothetical protein Csa_002823 [Cucumis sativus]|uniref:Uncharacterized protein n=1 Tax=Cucumis sativus TaxID=3659 RepID=A0A0A0KFR5_CUCSA|nr:hypothetical protein Csa_002823 [Cucumis sativus]